MKKTWGIRLTAMLALTMVMCLFALPVLAQELRTLHTAAEDVGLPENDELAELHIQSAFYGGWSTFGTAAGERLSGANKDLYDALKPAIEEIASGDRTSTVVSLDDAGIEYTYTAASEEEADGLFGADMHTVLTALLNDCPFDLYWFDKTTGFYQSFYSNLGDGTVTYQVAAILFTVAESYQGEGYTLQNPVVNADKTGAAAAAAKAQAIVDAAANKNDYEKLVYYRDQICALTSYNDAAADASYDEGYGDPWQLVWVFDEDPTTTVVCEGYAKAFQYLCDLTTFSGDVSCITVTGEMEGGTGAGGHMWNIVTMEDGKNYIVDVTNSDTGTVGQSGGLFLSSMTGSVENGYNFNDVSFAYDTETLNAYTAAQLTLASSDYEAPVHNHDYTYSYTVEGETHVGTCSCGDKEAAAPHVFTLKDGKYVCVCEAEAVASITSGSTTTRYADFANALTAWTNGTTLALLQDVSYDNGFILGSGASRTFNGGSYTLSVVDIIQNYGALIIEGGTISYTEDFLINNYGTLTLQDGTLNGVVWNSSDGTMTISGGTINGSIAGVVSEGTLSISGSDTVITTLTCHLQCVRGTVTIGSDVNCAGWEIFNDPASTGAMTVGYSAADDADITILAENYYLFNEAGTALVTSLEDDKRGVLTKHDTHNYTASYTNNGETHTGTCVCGLTGTAAPHTFALKDGKYVCDCGAVAVASITSGSTTTYYVDFANALTAWTDGTTLGLLQNVSYDKSITLGSGASRTFNGGSYTLSLGANNITNNGTLTVASGTISNTNANVAAVENSGTLTVSGGTVDGSRGVCAKGGKVTVSGGTVSGSVFGMYVEGGTVEVSSGTVKFTGMGTTYGMWVEGGTVKISGGTVEAAMNGSMYIGDGTVEISGGTLNRKIDKNGGTLTISGQASVTGQVTNYSGTLTISGGTLNIINVYEGVINKENGTLEITGGTLSSVGICVNNSGTLTIGGEPIFEAEDCALTYYGGTITIADKTTIPEAGWTVLNASGATMTVGDEAVDKAALTILAPGYNLFDEAGTTLLTSLEYNKMGTVTAHTHSTTYTISGETHTGACSCGLKEEAAPHAFTLKDGKYVCVCGAEAVASITSGSTTTYYADFANALTAWTNGTTLGLLQNVSYDDGIITLGSGASRTFNGGIYTLTLSRTLTNSGTLTVSGGTINSTRADVAAVENSGTLTVSGGTITGAGMAVYNSGSFTITSGKVKGENFGVSSSGGTATISGGTVECGESGANAVDIDGGTATISGGTVTGNVYNYRTLKITGGTVDGVVINDGGENGGEATISGEASITGFVNNMNAGEMTISGGSIGQYVMNDTGCTLTISGGTITGSNGTGVDNYGTLTISGAPTLPMTGSTLQHGGGTITIASETTIPKAGWTVFNASGATMTVGDEEADKAALTILPADHYLFGGDSGETLITSLENHDTGTVKGHDHEYNNYTNDGDTHTAKCSCGQSKSGENHEYLVSGECVCGAEAEAIIVRGSMATHYSFADALANWTDGTTLQLVKDVTYDETITLEGGASRTFDGDSYTLTLSGAASIGVKETDTLTVTGGTISAGDCAISNNGKVILEGGTVSGETYGVNNAGTVTVTDTAAVSGDSIGVYNTGTATISGTATVSGETYGVNNGGTLEITSGTVSGDSIGVYNTGTATISGTAAVSSDSSGVENTGTLTVTGGTVSGGSDGVLNTGSSAKATITGSATVNKTNTNVFGGSAYNLDGTMTISGSATMGGDAGVYNEGGTVYVQGGTAQYLLNYGGTAEISGTAVITVSVNNDTLDGTPGKMTITSGTIGSAENRDGLYNGEGCTLEITGGTITSLYNGVENYGTLTVGGAAKIHGNHYGVSSSGSATITGGTITGGGKTLNYSGGAIEMTGTADCVGWSVLNSSGAEMAVGTGLVLPADHHLFVKEKVQTTLTSGNSGVIGKHTASDHEAEYVADPDTLTITEQCKVCGEPFGAATLILPTETVYTGDPIGATCESTISGVTPVITYYNANGEALTGAPTEARSYIARLTADSVFVEGGYSIMRRDASGAAVAAAQPHVYTGEAITPTLSVTLDGRTLEYPTDYMILNLADNTNAGQASGQIGFLNNYKGTKDFTFEILARQVTPNVVGLDGSYLYQDGAAIEPTFTLEDDQGKTISADEYDVTYANNKALGTATITVTDKDGGNYAFSQLTVTFEIITHEHEWTYEADPSALTITATCSGEVGTCPVADRKAVYQLTVPQDLVYNGQPQGASFTVSVQDSSLEVGEIGYTYATIGDDNALIDEETFMPLNAGTYKAILAAGGAEVETTLIIAPVTQGVTATAEPKTYNAYEQTANVVVQHNGATLVKGTDYTVTAASQEPMRAAGTYPLTVTGMGNYGFTVNVDFVINPADIATATVDPLHEVTYTGGELKEVLFIHLGNKVLTEGTDYTVVFSDNINAGTATVTITGQGSITGTRTEHFTILPRPIEEPFFIGLQPSYLYEDGAAIEPAFTLRDGDNVTIPADEYDVTYSNNTELGTATITVTDKEGGNYIVSGTATFEIVEHNHVWTYEASGSVITATCSGTIGVCPSETVTLTLESPADTVYNGKGKEATVTVDPANALAAPTVVYDTADGSAPVNVGSYTASIGLKDAVATTTFAITPAALPQPDGFTATGAYTGQAHTPEVVIDGCTLGTDYTVTGESDMTNVGDKTLTVTGLGNYEGATYTLTYTITPADIAAATVTAEDQVYTGAALEPQVTVTFGAATLTEGTDYTVAYGNNTDVGPATVTITGQGNYTGTASGTFAITTSGSAITARAQKEAYTYGETVAVDVTISATGSAPQAGTFSLLRAVSAPADNQVALYLGDMQISEPATVEGGKATLTVETAQKILPIGTTALTVKYTGGSNTAAGTASVSVTIVRKPITLSALNGAASKLYDGTTDCDGAGLSIALDGVLTGDDVQAAAAYSYQDANAGTGKTVTASVTSLTGADAAYYELSQTQTEAACGTIEKAALAVSGSGTATGVYGSELSVSGLTVVLAHRSDVTVPGTWTVDGGAQLPVSQTSAAAAFTPADPDNFILPVEATVALAIRPAAADGAVVGLDPVTFVYDGTEKKPSVTVSLRGAQLAEGTDYEVGYPQDMINAGGKDVTLTFKGNYTGTLTATYQITPAESAFVTGVGVYNGETPTTTFTYGDTITVKAKPEPAAATFGLRAMAAPVKNQMALFAGSTQISEAVDPDGTGVYTMTYNTADKALTIGENAITLQFVGSDNLQSYSQDVTVTLLQKELTIRSVTAQDRIYNSDMVSVRITGAVFDGKVMESDDVSIGENVYGTLASDAVGVYTTVTLPETIALTGAHAAYYTAKGGTQAETNVQITEVPADLQTKVEVQPGVAEIPQALIDAGFDTAEKIDARLKTVLEQQNPNLADTALYDAKLLYSEDGGLTWIPADKEHFPAGGKVNVLLPIPEGTDPERHEYFVAYMYDTDDFGHLPGETASPEVAIVYAQSGAPYLSFEMIGTSPIMVGWELKAVAIDLPDTGDHSNLIIWVALVATAGAALVLLRKRARR